MEPTCKNMARLLGTTAAALTLACGASDAPSQPPPVVTPPELPGEWRTMPTMATSRAEMAGALLDGRIYIPGGLTTMTDALTVMEAYEPTHRAWVSAPPLPEGRHHFGLAAAGGKLYLVGGYLAGDWPWASSSKVFAYDPQTGEWTERAPLPVPRGAHVAVTVEGKIYAIGGMRRRTATNVTEVYDPETDSWQTLAPMAYPREHLAAAVIDGRIYVVGGRVPGRSPPNVDYLERYDPATDTWTTLPSLPTPRSGLAAAALGGRLYVFGGEIPFTYRETEEYDPATARWRRMADMPTARHGLTAVTAGDTIFVIGGGPTVGASHSRLNQAFTKD